MIKLIYTLLMMIVCTFQGCISDNEPEGPSLKVGDSLPDFSVSMCDGTIVSTSTLKGKVPVIVFFNTGCKDCQKELPVIQRLWEIYKDNETVAIVPIAREEEEKEIQQYWNQKEFTMPYSPQENREIYSLFAKSVIPRIYIANPYGIITAAYGDSENPQIERLISDIKQALIIQ